MAGQGAERLGEWAVEGDLERAEVDSDLVAEPVAEQAVERALGQAAEAAVDRMAERAVEAAVDRMAERAVDSVGGAAVDRAAAQRQSCRELHAARSRTSPGCALRQPRAMPNRFERVNGMMVKRMLRLIAAGGLFVAAFGQSTPKIAPVPGDPLELATGPVQVVASPARRDAALKLLARARESYALRKVGRAYDLKVSFTVNSGGQTDYDGAWRMEDLFDPQQGHRWTAAAESGYSTTRISARKMFYGDGTASMIPLRLHEARAALLGPIPSAQNVARELIRTSPSTYNGVPVTCILLSDSEGSVPATPRRAWEETEDCIDPQSGLLQVQSQVPGRYYAYDYTNAPQLGDCRLPRQVKVTEAGKIVSEITVESLTEIPAADSSLFVPSDRMKAKGPAIAMTGAQKVFLDSGVAPFAATATVRPVCVFGLVTPTGQIAEAHSLQPSDPNSRAAVDAAKRMNFSIPVASGARPQQHFVFVIERFASSQ